MDEGRKRTILIAASILIAQKAAHLERNSPAMQAAISDALGLAEMIMLRIDNRWHTTPDQRMNASRSSGGPKA